MADLPLRPSTRGGFSLPELLVVLAILSLSFALALPSILSAAARNRVRLAAGEISSTFRMARSEAIRRSANVGVKFRSSAHGWTFTLYADGDGDGVRNDDLRSGVDPAIGPEKRLAHLSGGVRIGILQRPVPRDPADRRRYLTHLDDPIRFNNSDIAAFSSLGTATPGSIYLTDDQRAQVVIRVLGASGRLRTRSYDIEHEVWVP